MVTLISEENIREEITDFISDFDDEIVPKRELSSTYILSTFLLTFFNLFFSEGFVSCFQQNRTRNGICFDGLCNQQQYYLSIDIRFD